MSLLDSALHSKTLSNGDTQTERYGTRGIDGITRYCSTKEKGRTCKQLGMMLLGVRDFEKVKNLPTHRRKSAMA